MAKVLALGLVGFHSTTLCRYQRTIRWLYVRAASQPVTNHKPVIRQFELLFALHSGSTAIALLNSESQAIQKLFKYPKLSLPGQL